MRPADPSTLSPAARQVSIACPRCAAAMQRLGLSTHHGRGVTVDHCAPCRLVWFDRLESVQLDGLGWVKLLREMQPRQALPEVAPSAAALACPGCRDPLKPVSNQTRFGRFVMLECPQRHGHLHSHAGVLAERGLLRPLLGPERKALREEKHRIACFNCGAPADGSGDACTYCGTTLVVVDLPRLAQSLKPRVVNVGMAPVAVGRAVSWSCRGCGQALDPSRHNACPRCGHLVVALELPDLVPLLDAAEAELKAPAQAAPAAATVSEPAMPGWAHAGPADSHDDSHNDNDSDSRSGDALQRLMLKLMLRGWTPLWLALAAALLAAWMSGPAA
jgi:hypothetical protein